MATTVTLKPNAIDISGSTSGTTTLQATAVAGTTTLTLPAATDTLVGRDTTDTLTNKTLAGAAMNGTLGATTPSTVAATTITTSSTVTHNGGTANGVAYLNGSKVLTTGSALVFDGTNLGVGTSSPTAKLTVSGNQSFPEKTAAYIGVDIATTSGNGGNFTVKAGNGSGAGNTAGNLYLGAGRGAASASNGAIYFGTAQGTNAVGLDATLMTLEASGNLLMGMAATVGGARMSVQPASGTGVGIETNGSSGYYPMWFQVAGTQKGYITTATGGTTYNTTSDYRLKENIQPMTGALAKVAQLKPCTYVWKETGDSGQGFIAHELAEIVPECVTGEKDGTFENGDPLYQGIDTSNLVATLTAAIQEQQAIISTLTDRITALEAR
jgi:hypothetical protein